jgi:hypothetical protein
MQRNPISTIVFRLDPLTAITTSKSASLSGPASPRACDFLPLYKCDIKEPLLSQLIRGPFARPLGPSA